MARDISIPHDMPCEFTEMVKMRDGTSLATDIYLPESGHCGPVLIERTPYNRKGVSGSEMCLASGVALTRVELARWFCARGYGVVMQDVRGRHGSEGIFSKYINEAEDGFDSYAWIVEQPWCDGRICSMGLSYGGHTQLAAACATAPGLSGMFLDTGGLLNAYEHSVRYGGAFELKQLTWAFKHARQYAIDQGDMVAVTHFESLDLTQEVLKADWKRGKSPLAVVPEYEAYLLDLWEQETAPVEWLGAATCAERWFDRMPDVPVFLLGSWNDPYAQSMNILYEEMKRRFTSPVQLLMGPWLHGRRNQSYAGTADFGAAATLNKLTGRSFPELRLAWFDFALGKTETPWQDENVYFEMGGGDWSWNERGHLDVSGRWLSKVTTQASPEEQVFRLDENDVLQAQTRVSSTGGTPQVHSLTMTPDDPFRTIGGAITSGAPIMEGGMFLYPGTGNPESPFNRPDILVFETAPLSEDMLICGTPLLNCQACSDAEDFDLAVFLFEKRQGPDDFSALNITDGIQRARFADPERNGLALSPGEEVKIEVRLMTTAYRLKKGGQLLVLMTGGNFPRFDVNTGTGRSVPTETGSWKPEISVKIRDIGLKIQTQEGVPLFHFL
ncbi:CocE/NonD family hydrolase [Kiloniella laminariae]|uniref:CocE/NonD family hydrolase n=1 Tax=Kiloniella laminariae TaxID=454162 RepID=A0ABT4LSX1_9PROT|nr:CocE/NonD family hydrolase [Kiloniella laminariae]MCZ4283032.1 CocE/NonD family hydrolase [Kiloniella laminariae]